MTEHGELYLKGNWWLARTDSGTERRVAKADRLPAGLGDGSRVSFEWVKGQAKNLRAEGETVRRSVSSQRFLNPYGFVPTPDRKAAGHDGSSFGDQPPAGHHRLHDDCWTGRIRVTMRTETPLLSLVPAADREPAGDDPRRVFRIAERDSEGERRPHVAPTSVKGMLRSEYETITNSRFGIFPAGGEDETGHGARLAYRMATQEALGLIPARVSASGDEITLLGGTTEVGGLNRNTHQYAAWIPWYGHHALEHGAGDESHGQEFTAGLQSIQHPRRGFRYWRVVQMVPLGEEITEPAEQVVTGWVNVTGRNIGNKHDERLFFATGGSTSRTMGLEDRHRELWADVIDSYRGAHTHEEIWQRKGAKKEPDKYLGREPGSTAWSRHLWNPESSAQARKLVNEQLLYVKLDRAGKEIIGLYPVMIARQPFERSPLELAEAADQEPAASWNELSSADRVFGWVGQAGRGSGTEKGPAAWAGKIRVGAIRSSANAVEAIEYFEREVPLSILGIPKPTQGRFYVRHPKADGSTPPRKGEWYGGGDQRLKGRKFYFHHAGLLSDYWEFEAGGPRDPTQENVGGRFREYLRTRKPELVGQKKDSKVAQGGQIFETKGDAVQDTQNRSITGWIKPDQRFTFDLHVRNLTDAELGALLWLVSPHDAEHGGAFYHRLGYGKPLGFGSIELGWDSTGTEVARGSAWRTHWASLASEHSPDNELDQAAVDDLAAAFASEVDSLWPGLLQDFLAFGHGDPGYAVHYPRLRPHGISDNAPVPPDPQGRSYEWFVENERTEGGRDAGPVNGTPLPEGLGSLPIRGQSSSGGRGESRGGGQNRRRSGGGGRPGGGGRGKKGGGGNRGGRP